MINSDIMKQMEIDFGPEMKRTSGHKMRSYNDLQYQFMYYNYIIESHHFQIKLMDAFEHVDYCDLDNNYYQNLLALSRTRNQRMKFVCINDDINHGSENAKYTYDLVNNFYNEFYPEKSKFEL